MFFTLSLLAAPFAMQAQTEFEFEPYQTMLMTGKGPGQDGTINPYYGQDCIAIVGNMGPGNISVRIESKGEFLRDMTIAEGETKRIKLMAREELYIDSESKSAIKTTVDYEQIK